MTHNTNPNANPRINVTTIKHLGANEIIGHISMPVNQTIKKLFINPIHCRPCVHVGTYFNFLID